MRPPMVLVRAVSVCLLLLLAGCGSSPPPRSATTYVVQAGDTLYAIAWRNNLDWRELARWNGLGEDAHLNVGQRLVLQPRRGVAVPKTARRKPQAAAPGSARDAQQLPPVVAGPAPAFVWPVGGAVLGEQAQPSGGFGLRLKVQPGEEVHAAAAGRVAYVGSGLRSYGQLVIVKHPEGWLSAYGYNRVPRVKEGDNVQRGQVLAEAGEGPLPAGGTAPQLYFEIRRLGRAVDPRTVLPAHGVASALTRITNEPAR